MAKTNTTAAKMTKSLEKKLTEYLNLKMQMKDLEDEIKELETVVFAKPEILPDTYEVDGKVFVKQTRNPVVAVTQQMVEDAGLNLDRIMPLATFSMTLVGTVYGKSGKAAVEETDAYSDELAIKKISVFYKKK